MEKYLYGCMALMHIVTAFAFAIIAGDALGALAQFAAAVFWIVFAANADKIDACKCA